MVLGLGDIMPSCPDCGRYIEGDYRYAMHRAFKHDDWTLLDKWYYDHPDKTPFYE